MNELAPLFDKEHSKEKMAVKSVVAVAGLAAVSAIALCYFAPAGLGLTIMGESAVKWVGLHKVLSVTGAVAGTGATGIFGFQANTHSKQRNLMEQVRANHFNFLKNKETIVALLILRLFGGPFESIPRQILLEMGIQEELMSVEKYQQALFKTAFEDLSHSYQDNLVGGGGAPYVAIWPMRSVLLGAINTDADDVAPHLNQPSYLTWLLDTLVVPDVLVVPQAYYVGIERSRCVGRRRDGFFCVDGRSDAEFPSQTWIRPLFMRFVEKLFSQANKVQWLVREVTGQHPCRMIQEQILRSFPVFFITRSASNGTEKAFVGDRTAREPPLQPGSSWRSRDESIYHL
ncbi:putative glycine--tRNA ligase [Fusarium oxysporum f. sp. albedinis]|nr:putative glycine--tRNA ligase [Fusarium oxysporum f. sp. albedinis]